MKKYNKGDEVWIRIKGRPNKRVVKSLRYVSLQSGISILYDLGGSIYRYSHEVFKSKKGALT